MTVENNTYKNRMKWFIQDRFGMFIHWGIYSIPARGEWVRSVEKMSIDEYQRYYDDFNPKGFEPDKWATLAKNAGMRYAVLTAKHHDGFCMFDSKYTGYKSTNTAANRDFVREFLLAFRKQDIKVGLYYSLLDWYHPDYPHYKDMHHPMRDNIEYKDKPYNFNNYLTYMHKQVEELCTDYGKLDMMWFDFSYGDMRGEKWEATKLINMVRRLQPDIIIDNRLEASGEGFGSIITATPKVYSGDYVSPEQIIPPNGLFKENGDELAWEACITMNDNWGYSSLDKNFKPASTIIKKLVECVSKNGNMLLNVGPNANGEIPPEEVSILNEIGHWMKNNHSSIYGCRAAKIDKPENGRITQGENGKKLYYHIMENSIGYIPLYGVDVKKIRNIRLLSDGSELKLANNWIVNNYPNIAFVKLSNTAYLPDEIDTVVEVTLT